MNKNHDIEVKQIDIQNIEGGQNEPDEKFPVPLSGKLVISTDPILIGDNFRTIENMRYVPGHPEGILGMTKINSGRMDNTYYKARSAFMFTKTQPFESHVLVQSFDTSFTNSIIIENMAPIPTSANFSGTTLWIDTVDPNTGVPNVGMFSHAPGGQIAYCNGVDSCIWGGNEMRISAFITATASVSAFGEVTNPKDFSERMQNTKQDTDNVCVITTNRTLLVGSSRPLKGITPYILIGSGNTTTSILTGKTWTGSAWTTITLTDMTSSGGASLAKTGLISFPSTIVTAKPLFIEGYFLYWYQLTLSAGGATLYKVDLDAPFQKILDLWDGLYRSVSACYVRENSEVYDRTVDVLHIDFDVHILETFIDLNGMGAFSEPNNYLEIGFTEKQTALYFVLGLPGGANLNPSVMTVDYWNGTEYSTVGTILDGTSAGGGDSLRRSGIVSWSNTNLSNEIKCNKAKSITDSDGGVDVGVSLYFYRVKFSNAVSTDTWIDYIGGIPAQKEIGGYSFPMLAADRLMFGCDNTGRKNSLLISAENQYDVFNGNDSYKILFGDDKPLVCGTSIFAQYASNIYNMALLFKATETWSLVWQQTTSGMQWVRYNISPNIGCSAPRTLRTISAAFGKDIGEVKVIAIWRADDGIYVSNGQAPLKISGDIDPLFDQSNSLHVNTDMLASETSFVDEHLLEYHWLWASGTNTVLDKETVLDLKTWKFFTINRGTNNNLQLGLEVIDTLGNNYTYGFVETGYMERLEYGTTFDGQPIVQTLELGDMLLSKGDMFMETSVVRINLVTIAKNYDTSAIITHAVNGSSIGTEYTMSITDTTHRFANVIQDIFSVPAIYHSFKFVVTTNNETKGFCPLFFAAYIHKERDRVA